jgi:hypothetical protein
VAVRAEKVRVTLYASVSVNASESLSVILNSVRQQSSNVGLARQWLEVWQPAENSQEAAFIFEDDIEVQDICAQDVRALYNLFS